MLALNQDYRIINVTLYFGYEVLKVKPLKDNLKEESPHKQNEIQEPLNQKIS